MLSFLTHNLVLAAFLSMLPLLSNVTYYAFGHVLVVTAPCFPSLFELFYSPSSLYNPSHLHNNFVDKCLQLDNFR